MTTYQWLTIIIVICGFIGNAMYLKGVFGTKIENCEKKLGDLTKSVRFADTCDARFNDHEKRVKRLEVGLNGKIKG